MTVLISSNSETSETSTDCTDVWFPSRTPQKLLVINSNNSTKQFFFSWKMFDYVLIHLNMALLLITILQSLALSWLILCLKPKSSVIFQTQYSFISSQLTVLWSYVRRSPHTTCHIRLTFNFFLLFVDLQLRESFIISSCSTLKLLRHSIKKQKTCVRHGIILKHLLKHFNRLWLSFLLPDWKLQVCLFHSTHSWTTW